MSSVKPPYSPWIQIEAGKNAGGYLSFYYSDDMSVLPVRCVTKPGDNKSDPNIETLTYGLFSTCSPSMRSGAVRRKWPHLFFVTSRNGERVLTGYYHVGWYAQGPLGERDYCLAADAAHFVKDPIPLAVIDKRCGTKISGRFRGMRLLTGAECQRIRSLLHAQVDFRSAYLQEIDRLERFNLLHGGYRYIGWKQGEPFSWEYARNYLKPTSLAKSVAISNSSLSGIWQCRGCGQRIKNKALLKRCPACGCLGQLSPYDVSS